MHENSVYEGWNFEGENDNKIGDESLRSSSYGEGVFDLIQDIFNVQVEVNDSGLMETRSRTRAKTREDYKEKRKEDTTRTDTTKLDEIKSGKKYGSINVRTLSMKGDRYKREICGATVAASEWILEFQARGLGVVGLQECRVKGDMAGKEGPYHTFYTGEKEDREHGVGIFVLENIISGEVEIRHVNARLMWIAGVIYGVHHVIVSAYAPTNDEHDNGDS